MNDDDIGERSGREAAQWMIALRERPDDAALHRRFRAWRRSAGNDAAWRELDRVDDLIRRARAVPPPPGRRRRRPASRQRRGGWKATALAMTACAAAMVIGSGMLPPVVADATTGTGEVRRLRLADGSSITLAPHSAVAVDDARAVRLLKGTAFFDVRHDAARPFRVVAGRAVATDLGTAFEVRRDGPAMHVAVRAGLVGTSCAGGWRDPGVLRPGDARTVDCAAGTHRQARLAPASVAAWIAGQLVVDDRPLGEVVAALRPWHRGLLVARGAGMARRVTGIYDLRDPQRALVALRQSHRVTTTTVTPWLTIVHAD